MDSPSNLSGLLQQLAHIIAASSTFEHLSPRLAQAIGEVFGAEACSVISFTIPFEDPEIWCWFAEQDTVSVACLPSGQHYLMQHSLHIPSSPSTVSPPIASAPSSLTHLSESVWPHLQISTPLSTTAIVLEISTQYQGCPNGRISLMRSPAYPWSKAEVEVLEIVSQHIAMAFSHLQLQQKMEQQLQYQGVVNQLTLAIRHNTDLIDIIQSATQGVTQALRGVRGMLLRIRYADPLARSHAADSIPKARVTVTYEWFNPTFTAAEQALSSLAVASRINQSFWLAECDLCRQAFHSSVAVAKYNTRHELGPTPDPFQEFFSLEYLHSLLIMPLTSQGTILGFLLVQGERPRQWQESDIDLMELVSAQLSNAIIQTETLRQVQSLVDKRTAELQHSLTIQAKLHDRTRQQLDQLRQLNHLKDEFLDTVSHELRTPLTSMALAIRMLKQVGISSDRSSHYLDILEQQCAQETNLVNDLLALRELESKQVAFQVEQIDLINFVQEITQSFQSCWVNKGLTFDFDCPDRPVPVYSDRDSLHRIVLELLTNATKYSTPHSLIQLKLIQRQKPPMNQVILSLSNTGSGIFPEELPFVFDKFRRCQGATQNAIQGTGLGLALVKSLVQHLNGTISVASTPLPEAEEWETCFTLILPQVFDPTRDL